MEVEVEEQAGLEAQVLAEQCSTLGYKLERMLANKLLRKSISFLQ